MPNKSNILKMLHELLLCLNGRRRIQFFVLLVLMAFSSVSEAISLGAIIPFLGVLTDPQMIYDHENAQFLIEIVDAETPQDLLIPITGLFCAAVLLAGCIRLLLLYAITRYSHTVGSDISADAYRRTLFQPYMVHVSRNSSEVISGIVNKAVIATGSILVPSLMLISSIILLVGILLTLLILDPVIAGVAGGGFTVIYLIILKLSRQSLQQNSKIISNNGTRQVKLLQEGLGGIRDVLIDGTQDAYCEAYYGVDYQLRRAQGNSIFIGASPRFLLETIGMILIAVLALSISGRPGGLIAAVPILGALALGAQRLLPMLQQAYNAASTIRAAEEPLRDILQFLHQPMPTVAPNTALPLPFTSSISLEGLGFHYGLGSLVLEDVSVNFPKGARIGIIGKTGSGKSTLLDIFMGLLTPTKGKMLIDGCPVTEENQRAWQSHVAHVPQSIFLTDSSIEENIAFGIPYDRIDHDRVKIVAQRAQISELIESWPDKYQTSVGERGMRLSGGQRQRIGIARALYKNADVIFFDEATSALDNETERAVMDAINGLSSDLTVIIVAHRLSTLRECDQIVELGMGRVLHVGTYQELVTKE